MTTIPKITVKNLKHAAFASEETHCFEATVYVDGVKFCKASNDGHGGPDMYWRDGTRNTDLCNEINVLGKRINPNAYDTWQEMQAGDINDGNYLASQHFEIAVGEAVNRALLEKDCKRALANKRRVYGLLDGKVMYWTFKRPLSTDVRPKAHQAITEKNPGVVLLTTVEAALPHWS